MKLHTDSPSGAYRVTGYGSGYVAVNGERHTGSLVITPQRVIADWKPQSFGDIDAAAFSVLDSLEVEIVVLGTGASQHFLDGEVLGALGARRIGLEIMDTAAACRTYNILMAEGRTVAALLLPIHS